MVNLKPTPWVTLLGAEMLSCAAAPALTAMPVSRPTSVEDAESVTEIDWVVRAGEVNPARVPSAHVAQRVKRGHRHIERIARRRCGRGSNGKLGDGGCHGNGACGR